MDTAWIQIMEQQRRLKLDFGQTCTHYAIVALLLVIPCLSAYDLCSLYIFHNYKGVQSGSEICQLGLPFLLFAIFIFFIQIHTLKFKEIKVNHSEEQFKEVVERTAKQLEWRIEKSEGDFVRARRGGDYWDGDTGEMITIIRTDHNILINSICDPDNRPSFTWFASNGKNVKVFLQNLKAVINGIPESPGVPEKPEKEWSISKILTRIILYPLCIGLIILSVVMLIHSGSGAIYFIITSGLALTYLYSDLSMIFKKSK